MLSRHISEELNILARLNMKTITLPASSQHPFAMDVVRQLTASYQSYEIN
jgi:hypothetical protein